ncbi:hypothetical protein [Kutzneria sp. NPDC052558]|uniref:hypothetical protein n=1 Tax=Kutzneria sp. NPDC052558 TaxID=3364121 RepID=UPI0037C5D73B
MLYLAEGVGADVVPGGTINVPPRLSLDDLSVLVGSYDSAEEHERHRLLTHGSGNDLAPDEFRFNRDTGLLESLWLYLPEDNLTDPSVADDWLGLEPVVGALRRADHSGFTVMGSAGRWCAEDGAVLVCLASARPVHVGQPVRLRVADDVDLLFGGDSFAGWMLTNPERYVTSLWGRWPDPLRTDTELGVLLKQCLDLIDTPHMEALFEEEDPEGRRLLRGLRDRIALDRGAPDRRRALLEWLGFLEENWYRRPDSV